MAQQSAHLHKEELPDKAGGSSSSADDVHMAVRHHGQGADEPLLSMQPGGQGVRQGGVGEPDGQGSQRGDGPQHLHARWKCVLNSQCMQPGRKEKAGNT